MSLTNLGILFKSSNSKDIEGLKHQVSMGKGGIKAIFVVGSLIALIVAVLKFVKL